MTKHSTLPRDTYHKTFMTILRCTGLFVTHYSFNLYFLGCMLLVMRFKTGHECSRVTVVERHKSFLRLGTIQNPFSGTYPSWMHRQANRIQESYKYPPLVRISWTISIHQWPCILWIMSWFQDSDIYWYHPCDPTEEQRVPCHHHREDASKCLFCSHTPLIFVYTNLTDCSAHTALISMV